MRCSSHLLALALLTVTTPVAFHAQSPQSASGLSTLRPTHPRLIFLDSDLPRIHALISKDPFAATNYADLLRDGDSFLSRPVHPYLINGAESDLLDTARNVEHYILTLSGLYRLTGQRKYADRAIEEMLAASAYPDWNPKHFLDTAELSAGVGLGYDWLYPILTPAQRTTIRTALIDKGLQPFLDRNTPGPDPNEIPPHFHYTNNWAQVCYGGETIAALAIADEDPAGAETVLARSHQGMERIMQLFAPDGGFEEGPGYWGYATSFNVLYLAALDSALGTDSALSQMPGFSSTGDYRIQSIGPNFRTANFADAHEPAFRAPQMFWLANRFAKPQYTFAERLTEEAIAARPHNPGDSDKFLIFSLVFYHPPTTAAEPATVQSFQRVGQAFLRSDWSLPDSRPDPNALYIALKGGAARTNHGHLDLGSFVLDAFGERWAIDLGPESYGVPKYFDMKGPRWTYYRTRNESHNTLTIDGAIEDIDAFAPVSAIGQSPTGDQKFAVLNLNSVFKSQLTSWSRGVAILDNRRVLVQDDFTPNNSVPNKAMDVVWTFMTHAVFSPGATPREAFLTSNGKMLRLKILSPAGAEFATHPIPALDPPQTPVTDTTDVIIHLAAVSTPHRIAVLITTPDDPAPDPTLIPLTQWPK